MSNPSNQLQVKDLQEQSFEVDSVYYHDDYMVGVYLNNDIALGMKI